MRIESPLDLQSIGLKPLNQKTETKDSFANVLNNVMNTANESEAEDMQNTVGLLTGDVNDLHTSMIAMEKADIALQFTMQIRNKLLDSYNEIMRMQV